MNRLVAGVALCAACASSRSATVALRAEEHVKAKATVETHVTEERGASTTVVEEFEEARVPDVEAPAIPRADVAPGATRMDVKPPPRTQPMLTRRTTIRQEPTRVVTAVVAETARSATTKTEGASTFRSETHVGWGFSLWLVLVPLAAIAVAYALWRFRPWIH